MLYYLSIMWKDDSVMENGDEQCKGLGCSTHDNFKKFSLWN